MGFKIVIPARYGAQRLPGKPLRLLAGKPLILHVCERAARAGAEEVVVATDDGRIFKVVSEAGFRALMSDPGHQSGTSRLAEVAERLGWSEGEIVVNWQGDEPLLPPEMVKGVATALAGHPRADVATLAVPLKAEELFDPHVVKVVLNREGEALYFSRAPIPWWRERFPEKTICGLHLRHIGLYAYRVEALRFYRRAEPSPLEEIEKLEQLRFLWHGRIVYCMEWPEPPPAGVDTEEDLRRLEAQLESS